MARLAPSPPIVGDAPRKGIRWWHEVLLLLVLYVMYAGVRLLVPAEHPEAFANAHRVLDLERAMAVEHEGALNRFISARPVLAVLMSYSYALLHYLITPMVLVWLWKKWPTAYPGARSSLVIATLLGLIGFWLFPTAPPRMLPDFVDTLARYQQWGWWAGDASAPQGLAGLTNEFAAMPSLHVGWAAWCGWQMVRHAKRRLLRVLAAIYPFFIFAVVVGTANHYIADAVAGLAVIAIGGVVVWLARGRTRLGVLLLRL